MKHSAVAPSWCTYELDLCSKALDVVAGRNYLMNAYYSRPHKPVIIPEPCLREPSRSKTKTDSNDGQRPGRHYTTFYLRVFVGFKS